MNGAPTNGVTGLFCSSSLSRIVSYYAMSVAVKVAAHSASIFCGAVLRLSMKEDMGHPELLP